MNLNLKQIFFFFFDMGAQQIMWQVPPPHWLTIVQYDANHFLPTVEDQPLT